MTFEELRTNLKRQENALLGTINGIQTLIRQRDGDMATVDQRQDKRVIEKQKAAIRDRWSSKIWPQAAIAKQGGDRARETLDSLRPEVLEERADFTTGSDELAFAMRVQNSSPDRLRELATLTRQEGNRAKARVLRREVPRRDDVDRETVSMVLDTISIPPSAEHLECAEIAQSILTLSQRAVLEARAGVKGHRLNPVQRLSAARELAASQRKITAWGELQPTFSGDKVTEPEERPSTDDTATDTESEDSETEDAAA